MRFSFAAPVSVQTKSASAQSLTVQVRFDSLFATVENATVISGGHTAIYPLLVAVPEDGDVAVLGKVTSEPSSSMSADLADISETIPVAYLDELFTVRGTRMARIIVSPFQNGQWYRQIEVTLSFSGSGSGTQATAVEPENKLFEQMYSAAVVSSGTRASGSIDRAAGIESAVHPFDLNQDWTKITVSNSSPALATDLYRVTGTQLAQAGYTLPIPSSQLRLFNGGGLPVEVDNSRPRPNFRECAISVMDGGDGQFNSGDYFLFVGEKTDRWLYRAGVAPRFNHNIYTTDNVYWLGVSPNFSGAPSRMTSQNVTPGASIDTAITSVAALVHVEQDHLISQEIDGHFQDYYHWAWTDAAALSIQLATPGRVSGDTADLLLFGKTNNCCGTVSFMSLLVNGSAPFSKNCNRFNCSFRTTALLDGANTLALTFGKQASGIAPYFDNVELTYHRLLRPDNDQFAAALPKLARTARLDIADQFLSAPLLYDVTDAQNPILLSGAARNGGLVSLDLPLSDTIQRQMLVTVDSRIQSPASLTRFTLNNLRSQRPSADLIVVAPRAFLGAMQEYVTYRQQQGYQVLTTPVEEIMDNFSYGLYDPMAIRDYLNLAYHNFPAPAPAAALFVGDASFDFLDHFGTGQKNAVPVSIQGRAQSYSDDNFVYFGDYGLYVGDTAAFVPGNPPDMVVGRWPVKSTADIRTIIGKIKRYESAADDGDWRNRIVLVADDQFSSGSSSETFHAIQTEQLERQFIPPGFERRKIYQWEYPFSNREKPTCNDAIVGAFNDGALIVNYVGHGNPDVWAHEHTLKRTVDLPRMTNRDKLPLVFAASCAIGFFDDPTRQGMGEDFLTMANGGAIGVIAASRLVYSFDNSEFNKKAYEVIFAHPELTIAQQFYLAKLLRQYKNGTFIAITNDQQYIYFGDPLLKLRQPTARASVTLQPASLTALARMNVHGELRDTMGQLLTGSGSLALAVLDADRARVFKLLADDGTLLQQITYLVNGPALFRGSVTASNGQYDLNFIPPADLSFGELAARIVAYASIAGTQAVGLLDSIPIADTVATNRDTTGPSIRFSIAGRENFASGDRVLATDTLLVTLADSLGINLSGSISHVLSLSIDGNEFQQRNLTGAFAYSAGSYTTGSAAYPLKDLSEGEHRLTVHGWDNANNEAVVSTSLLIVGPTAAVSSEILAYPNPMQDETTFYFTLSSPARAVYVDIYTLSGRKIRSLRGDELAADAYPNSQMQLRWDGRDYAGDKVASGVYLFHALMTADNSRADEQYGKIVVVKK